MSVDDRLINVRMDQLLTRRGIDTAKMNISSHQGSVTISGILKSRNRRADEMQMASDMKRLDLEMRKIPNVRDVAWRLENWRREEGAWKRVKAATHGGAVSAD